MKVRELLQTELWSKETSRKILGRANGVLVRVGIVLGILVVAIGVLLLVAVFPLTPGERNAARTALAQVDTLQDFGSNRGEDFDSRADKARRCVEAAEKAAWTGHDKNVSNMLSEYLFLTRQDHEEWMVKLEFQRREPQASANMTFMKKLDSPELRSIFRSTLHKELD